MKLCSAWRRVCIIPLLFLQVGYAKGYFMDTKARSEGASQGLKSDDLNGRHLSTTHRYIPSYYLSSFREQRLTLFTTCSHMGSNPPPLASHRSLQAFCAAGVRCSDAGFTDLSTANTLTDCETQCDSIGGLFFNFDSTAQECQCFTTPVCTQYTINANFNIYETSGGVSTSPLFTVFFSFFTHP